MTQAEKDRGKENRAYYKRRQRCTICHAQDAFTMNGRCLCADCAEKGREANRRRYLLHKEQYAEKNRRAYYGKKAAGRCTRCGRPVDGDTVDCRRCRKRQDYKEVLRKGGPILKCYGCGGLPDGPGYMWCSSCKAKIAERMREWWTPERRAAKSEEMKTRWARIKSTAGEPGVSGEFTPEDSSKSDREAAVQAKTLQVEV